MVRRALIFVLVVSSGMCGAAPALMLIVTRQQCSKCEQVKEQAAKHTFIVGVCTSDKNYRLPLYPTCYYDNGTTDTGDLVLNGACAYFAQTQAVEYIPKRAKR